MTRDVQLLIGLDCIHHWAFCTGQQFSYGASVWGHGDHFSGQPLRDRPREGEAVFLFAVPMGPH